MIVESLKQNTVAVFHLNEERLDVSNVDEISKYLLKALTNSPLIVIDLSHLEYMDSSGLGMILNCYRKVKEMGSVLKVVATKPLVLALFELVYLEKILEIHGSVDLAVKSEGDLAKMWE